MRASFIALAGLASLAAASARAETLITTVSTPRVAIQSNFTGADIVVFGGIGREAGPRVHGRYDIVVTVRGPLEPLDVRVKQRIFGIWLNNDRRAFRKAPSYLAIASTRPPADLAPPDAVRQFGLSLGIPPSIRMATRRGPRTRLSAPPCCASKARTASI